MLVAKLGKLLRGTAKIKRAVGIVLHRKHSLFRTQYFCRFGHEPNPGDDNRRGRMLIAKTSHFE